MESLAGSQTEKNLLKAFAGESQARNRYEFFAKQAKAEGLKAGETATGLGGKAVIGRKNG